MPIGILLERLPPRWERVRFQITEQPEIRGIRAWRELCGQDLFVASNGWSLCSAVCPEIQIWNKTLFLRGIDPSSDSIVLETGPLSFSRIEVAISEFNRFWESRHSLSLEEEFFARFAQ